MPLLRRAAVAALLAAFTLGAAHFVAAAESATPPACGGRDIAAGLDLAAARAARADELTDGQGLLWRVERDGLAPSYLFGTIHSTDDGAAAIAAPRRRGRGKGDDRRHRARRPVRRGRPRRARRQAVRRGDRSRRGHVLPDLAGATGASVETLSPPTACRRSWRII